MSNETKANEEVKKKVMIIVECGITVDKGIKKLYEKYGDSELILSHNRIDTLKSQIKDMTDCFEKEKEIMICICGNNYKYICNDVLELLSHTKFITWYVFKDSCGGIIDEIEGNIQNVQRGGQLIIFNDSMQIVKIFT